MYGARQYFVGVARVWYHTHKSRTLEKIRSTMMPSRPRLVFAISQRILLLFLISDKRRSPYKLAQLPLCSDPHGKEKPLSSPSQEIVKSDVRHHRIPAIREEEHGHFRPFQLWSFTPSISLECGRKWGYL